MFDDLISLREPPPNRVGSCDGGVEHHLSEGAVMVAFAMHLLRTVPKLKRVAIHPDGEHGKRFDFRKWFKAHDFEMTGPMGTTSYGGTYTSASGETVTINPTSGRGDVVAELGEASFVAECKGASSTPVIRASSRDCGRDCAKRSVCLSPPRSRLAGVSSPWCRSRK
jgi:hypothetical protein